MKYSLLICISLILIFSSCSKKASDLIPTGGDTITMKVNGVSWTGTTSAKIIDSETLVVNAVNVSTQETLGIVIEKVTQTGNYKVKSRTGNALLFSQKTGVYSGWDNGEVTVTAITITAGKQVPSGTFLGTFIAKDGTKVTITEGKF